MRRRRRRSEPVTHHANEIKGSQRRVILPLRFGICIMENLQLSPASVAVSRHRTRGDGDAAPPAAASEARSRRVNRARVRSLQ